MSKISQLNRPSEVFDPFNKKHRQLFHEALKHKTWGRSPIRFWLDETEDSLMDQCTKKIAKYYLLKEFGAIENPEPFNGEGLRVRPNPSANVLAKLRNLEKI
jgi:hypothetical protein